MSSNTSAPRWLPAISFLIPFGLYLTTAARTVQGGDAGELGLVGMLGGVAHPPGYPLYTLLARGISYLPIDPPFFRMSLTSVLCGAAAVAVLQRVAWRLTDDPWASALSALAVGLSGIQWRIAGIPEVFTLHALIVALVLLFTLRVLDAAREDAAGEMLWLGLIFGLGASNHLTIVFCMPLGVAGLISIGRRFGAMDATRAGTLGVLGGVLGLTPYLLLLSWGRLDPTRAWVWGETGTFHGLLSHFLREQYGTFKLRNDVAGTKVGEWLLVEGPTILREYAYAFAVTGIAGAVVALRKGGLFAWALAASFALAGALFPALMNLHRSPISIEIAERFFLMPIVLLAPFVARGIVALGVRFPPLAVRAVLVLALALGAVGAYQKANWRADDGIERYMTTIVRRAPRDAILIGKTDTVVSALGWVNRVMHVRPDVHYIDVNLTAQAWYFKRIKREIMDFPLEYTGGMPNPGELGLALEPLAPILVLPWTVPEVREMKLEPAGLLYRVEQDPPVIPPKEFQKRLDADMVVLGELPDPVDAWSAHVREGVAYPWIDLMDLYKAAGDEEHSKAAEERVDELASQVGPGDSE